MKPLDRIVNFGGEIMIYAEMIAQLRLIAQASGHPNPQALVDRYLQGFDHDRGRDRGNDCTIPSCSNI